MRLAWTRESPPVWDADKDRIVGGAPPGVFKIGAQAPGAVVPGDWWRVSADGRTVGFGWMDYSWGDAEILLAVDPAEQDAGVGTFILDRLEGEAAKRGINYLYNVVAPTHPDRAALEHWLRRRGFVPSGDGSLLKRAVQTRTGR